MITQEMILATCRRRALAPLAALLVPVLLAGCPGEPPCLDQVAVDCAPLYEPTYDEIFARTLLPTCGQEGTACHAPEGARAGLVFADPDQAYSLLLGEGGAPARVLPDQPECSPLLVRIESDDRSFQMPPGQMLSEAERCAIRKWVAAGAPR
ncbi:MAG TPA: c-type cytochrome domain-containing protein [Kofleriaceae bacterium]|nr:c-type cytochrome domain-containing protein [Kofleriaceae bacterium]